MHPNPRHDPKTLRHRSKLQSETSVTAVQGQLAESKYLTPLVHHLGRMFSPYHKSQGQAIFESPQRAEVKHSHSYG